ncbi:MAG: TRAP transporter large permease [Spirochaetales bacterium]
MNSIIIIGSLFLFLFFRVPVAIALTLSASIGIYLEGLPLLSVIQRFYAGTESWVLMAIPFFLLAGNIMTAGGLSKRLVSFCDAVFGFLPGGLANVNIGASMLFGGISGSAVADTSAIGSVLIGEMENRGYSREYSAAITAASSPIGMIIPPSIPMILWSYVSSESLGAMFLGGVFPGIMVGVGLMGVSTFICVKRGYQAKGGKFDTAFLKKTLKDGLIALIAPVIIVGGIVTGMFTATESAVFAVAYSIIATGFIYRELSFKELPRILLLTGKTSASIMLIIGGSTVFSWVLALNQIPQNMGRLIIAISSSPLGFMILVSSILFILGMFLDISTIILLVGPIFAPIVHKMGVDPILAGLIFMVVLATGLITPPLGLCLFVVTNIVEVKLEKVAKECIPFIVLMLIVAAIMWIFPGTVLWLPSLIRK